MEIVDQAMNIASPNLKFRDKNQIAHYRFGKDKIKTVETCRNVYRV